MPAVGVLLAGGMATDPYPAGAPRETVLVVALALLAVPGAVAGALEEVRRARRPRDERLAEAAAVESRRRPRAEWAPRPVQPRPAEPRPVAPRPAELPTLGRELAVRALAWGFAQALLGIGLALLLTPLPVDDGWRTLPLVASLLGLVTPLLVLLGALAVAGARLLWSALRDDADGEPGVTASELIGRMALASLGLCLLGLATFGIPFAVVSGGDVDLPRRSLVALGRYAFTDADGPPGWLLALRVTCGMVYGGLLGVLVLVPLFLGTLAVTPRRGVTTDPTPAADLPPAPTALPAAPAPLPTPAPAVLTPRDRRQARRTAADRAEAHRRAVGNAVRIAVGTAAAWATAVGVAAWLATRADRDHLAWALVTPGRPGIGGTVHEVAVSRADAVALAAVVAGLPVLLAALGWYRTRGIRRTRGDAPPPAGTGASGDPGPTAVSLVSRAALALGSALVPGLIGCFLVSHWAGPGSDLLLLPGLWASVAFLAVLVAPALGAGTRDRRRRGRR